MSSKAEEANNRKLELVSKFASQAGIKGSVIAKCIECSVDFLDVGTWRKQVELCGCPDCPLYRHRPLPIK